MGLLFKLTTVKSCSLIFYMPCVSLSQDHQFAEYMDVFGGIHKLMNIFTPAHVT